MDKQLLLRWLEGMREVDRVTEAEEIGHSFAERWLHREQVQAMLSLMPNKPLENPGEPRKRWTLLKDRWLERRA